jgi:hypothetical protein
MHEPLDNFDVHNNVLVNGGIFLDLGGPVGGTIRENDITLNLTSAAAPINIADIGPSTDHVIVQANTILNTTNSTQPAISFQPIFANAVVNRMIFQDNFSRAEGTAGAGLLIQPSTGTLDIVSGSAINILHLINNTFIDSSGTAAVSVQNSIAGTGVQGVQIGEAYVWGGNYENTSTTGPGVNFLYDPFTGSGPIYFDGVRIKSVRNPGGDSPIQIGTSVDTHHNVTDVFIRNCKLIGTTSASGSFNAFFNTGIVNFFGGELINFTNGGGFSPGNATTCSGGSCTVGTKSPTAYYLKDVRQTNVSGTYTQIAGNTFTELRGPGQTALVSGDWAASAGWGTGPTVTPATGSFDSAGSVSITAGTTPAANPTLTLTFKKRYQQVPTVLVQYVSGVAGAFPTTQPVITWTTTNTTLVITFNDTPTAANVYVFNYQVVG